jgi:hypothetical protein
MDAGKRAIDDRTPHMSQGITLGDLIAHELGHLLLGTSEHSVAGIMRARWQARELQGILRPAMFFFPEQAKAIRAQGLARMASSGRG